MSWMCGAAKVELCCAREGCERKEKVFLDDITSGAADAKLQELGWKRVSGKTCCPRCAIILTAVFDDACRDQLPCSKGATEDKSLQERRDWVAEHYEDRDMALDLDRNVRRKAYIDFIQT